MQDCISANAAHLNLFTINLYFTYFVLHLEYEKNHTYIVYMQDCIAANAAYLYICTSLSVRYKHESPRGRVGTHSSLTSAGVQKLLVTSEVLGYAN